MKGFQLISMLGQVDRMVSTAWREWSWPFRGVSVPQDSLGGRVNRATTTPRDETIDTLSITVDNLSIAPQVVDGSMTALARAPHAKPRIVNCLSVARSRTGGGVAIAS